MESDRVLIGPISVACTLRATRTAAVKRHEPSRASPTSKSAWSGIFASCLSAALTPKIRFAKLRRPPDLQQLVLGDIPLGSSLTRPLIISIPVARFPNNGNALTETLVTGCIDARTKLFIYPGGI